MRNEGEFDGKAFLERVLQGLDLEGRRRYVHRLRKRNPRWSEARCCRFLVERSAWKAASMGALSAVPLRLPLVGALLPSLAAGMGDLLGTKYCQCAMVVDLILLVHPKATWHAVLEKLVDVTEQWTGCRDGADRELLLEGCRRKDLGLVRRQIGVKTASRLSWNLLGGRLAFLPLLGMVAGAWVDREALLELGWIAMGRLLGGEVIDL